MLAFGESNRLQIAKGRADFLGAIRDWIRLGFGSYFIHYEFLADRLAQVTVMRDAVKLASAVSRMKSQPHQPTDLGR